MKIAKYTITGLTPLLMHSERLANPFDDLTKELKAITGKRKKTEDDLFAMARIEFMGGLYYDTDAGVHLPGYNILAAIVGGGKIHKLGTAIKRAVIVNEDKVSLIYEGPKTPAKLFESKSFVDMRSVKVGTAKITRCRPKFSTWSAAFSVAYDENSIQKSEIDQCLTSAGLMVGIGDYRPRFGRFSVMH